MSPGLRKAESNIGRLQGSIGRLGGMAAKGAKTAATNLAKIGAVAAVGLAVAVKSGLANLADLENAVSSVDGAIKEMGNSGKLTGAQVAQWANQIEADIGAAFDDKDITAATANLIRFGSITRQNLQPAMVVMTDLAVKTGSVESASSLLGKALADPAKAAGKLARVGIVLTKSEQKQIEKMVKAGKVGQAQAAILELLSEKTRGAAAASQGPYQRALSIVADVTEDAQKALAEGFLPVIERVATVLSTELAKPAVMEDIRSFGRGLADSFDRLLGIITKIPWESVKDAMRLAGAGAKAALDLFTGLPPWVQTAVLTGWGLNKLTGGALGGIVGELGKGLVKGVLGMTAGVVNINAATVNGGGGPGAGPSVPGAATGGLAALGLTGASLSIIGAGIGAAAAAAIITDLKINEHGGLGPALKPVTDAGLTLSPNIIIRDPTVNGTRVTASGKGGGLIINPNFNTGAQPTKGGGLSGIGSSIAAAFASVMGKVKQASLEGAIARDIDRLASITSRLHAAKESGDKGRTAELKERMTTVSSRIDSEKQQLTSSIVAARDAAARAGTTTASATSAGASQVANAVRESQDIINISVHTNVTASDIVSTTVNKSRQGPSGGSRDGGSASTGNWTDLPG